MNLHTYKKIVFSIGVFALFSIAGGLIYAAERTTITTEDFNDFVVEPGRTEVLLDPGQHITKYVSITNRINKTVNYVLTKEDLVGSNDPDSPVKLLGNETGPYSLKDFITPEINTFSLKFGEKITIAVDISVPEKAEPRGHYGALIISTTPSLNADGTVAEEAKGGARIVSRIGSLFLVKVNGEGRQEASLHDFKTIGPKRLIFSHPPEGFEVALKNTGTVHLVPYGTVTIKNMVGKTVDILPINAYFSLPDSIRYIQTPWDKKFGFGRYTADLSLYRGYEGENLESKIAFWILPWKIIILAIVVILILVSIFYYISTRFELKKKG